MIQDSATKTWTIPYYRLGNRPEPDPFLRRRRFCRIRQKLNNNRRPNKQQQSN